MTECLTKRFKASLFSCEGLSSIQWGVKVKQVSGPLTHTVHCSVIWTLPVTVYTTSFFRARVCWAFWNNSLICYALRAWLYTAVLFCLPLGNFLAILCRFLKQLQVLPETMFQILPDTGSDTADEIADNQCAVAEPSAIMWHSDESQV